jgi:ubiquinone/menaquinone biosynthesis C-methylase UbiE
MTKKNTSKGKDVYKYEDLYNDPDWSSSWDKTGGKPGYGWHDWTKPKHLNSILSVISLKPKSILDIGCGPNEFLKHVVTEAKKKGIDGADSIRCVGVDCACPNADIISSAHDLPVEDQSFDLITALDVLEHIPEEEVEFCLAEFSRVCCRIYVKIACFPNTRTEADKYYDLHPCVKPHKWWINVISKYFPKLKKMKGSRAEFLILYAQKK